MTRGKDKVTALGSLQFPRKYHTHTHTHPHSLLAIYQCRSNSVVWWKVTKAISTAGLPVHLPHIPVFVCVFVCVYMCVYMCVCVYEICEEMPSSISLRFSPFTAITTPSLRLQHIHLTIYNRIIPKTDFFSLRSLTLSKCFQRLIFLLSYFLYLPSSLLFSLWHSLVPCAPSFSISNISVFVLCVLLSSFV